MNKGKALYCGVVSLFFVIGLGCMALRYSLLDVPLLPEYGVSQWDIEMRLRGEATGDNVKVVFRLPQNNSPYVVSNESFSTDRFPLVQLSSKRDRRAIWLKSSPEKGEAKFSYKCTLRVGPKQSLKREPGWEHLFNDDDSSLSKSKQRAIERLIEKIQLKAAKTTTKNKKLSERKVSEKLIRALLKDNSKDASKVMEDLQLGSFPSTARIAEALNYAEIPAIAVRGLSLDESGHSARVISWLEVNLGKSWEAYDLSRKKWGIPSSYFTWTRGDTPLFTATGINNPQLQLSVYSTQGKTPVDRFFSATGIAAIPAAITLERLPVSLQAMCHMLLILPLAAMAIVLLRVIVGLGTFGTFMPALLALAFRDMGLTLGAFIVCAVLLFGLVLRGPLNRMHLLVVPRLTVTLSLVVLFVVSFCFIAVELDYSEATRISALPMVVITMLIERMSLTVEELGVTAALRGALHTIVAALFAYWLITWPLAVYLLVTFPEMIFVITAIALLLGRYTGYKLSELFRFAPLIKRA